MSDINNKLKVIKIGKRSRHIKHLVKKTSHILFFGMNDNMKELTICVPTNEATAGLQLNCTFQFNDDYITLSKRYIQIIAVVHLF